MYDQKSLARKNVKITGYVIIFCVTLLSIVSTYSIMRDGWKDHGEAFSKVIGFVVVVVIEGTFLWLLRGFAVAFSETLERALCLIGMVFYGGVMLTNITLHYRIVKGFGLNDFEMGYISWGAPMVICVTLVLITMINMADPQSRQRRQELRIDGKQTASIWNAKELAIESETVAEAVQARAAIEAQQMVQRLLTPGTATASNRRQIGFGGDTDTDPRAEAIDYMKQRYFPSRDDQSKS